MSWQIYLPLTVTLELTNQCNLRCRHCYAGCGEKLRNELTLPETGCLLDELSRLGTVELELSGGEPLLRPDLFEIIGRAKDLNFSITLITNGTLLDREKAKRLGGFDLKHVQISLDGLKENHESLRGWGTYAETIKAIEILSREGVKVAVRTTVNKRNVKEIEEVADLAVRMGACKLGMVRFFPAGRGMACKDELMLDAGEVFLFHQSIQRVKEKYAGEIEISADPCGFLEDEIFLRYLREENILCPCGKTWCLIKADGVVSPCEMMVFYAGDARRQKIAEIWEKAPIMKKFREFDPAMLKGACGTCKYKKVCAGYCRALAVLHTGDFYAEDFTCYHVLKKGGAVYQSCDQ
ncbi:MAG: radical SAM protein [Peptococcaceae bacterium]|nr:radical SAM protein [Peptococcaceae bacterium]